jgi:8-oxo-dGTP diphosphatase
MSSPSEKTDIDPAPGAAVPVVCGVIVRKKRQFLAAQRGPAMSNAGLWEFPGGKVRKNESPGAALLRELDEELGVCVVITGSLTRTLHTYPEKTIELIPFFCRITGGALHPREHSRLLWISQSTAPALPWSPADIPVVEEVLLRLEKEQTGSDQSLFL